MRSAGWVIGAGCLLAAVPAILWAAPGDVSSTATNRIAKTYAIPGVAAELGTQVGTTAAGPDGGAIATYQKGAIYYHPQSGAQVLFGYFYDEYVKRGGPSGALGYPLTGQIWMYDGVGHVVKFRGGELMRRNPANAGQAPILLGADATVVDLPIPANQVWRITQANGWRSKAMGDGIDDSHGGPWAYCYDMIRTDGTRERADIAAAATSKIVHVQQDLGSGDGNPGNIVSQYLGRGRYASYLHIDPNSYTKRFKQSGGGINPFQGKLPQQLNWANRPTAQAGQVVAEVGDTGTTNYHLHFCVTTSPDRPDFAPFESVPIQFRNYEVSADGKTGWSAVAAGTPVKDEYVRHAGFGGAPTVSFIDPLNRTTAEGQVLIGSAGALAAGGKIKVALMSEWGEPLAYQVITVAADRTSGPWSYGFISVPAMKDLYVEAQYDGPLPATVGSVSGRSASREAKAGQKVAGWTVSLTKTAATIIK